jgi:multidrug efflux pump subunit AcrA (membrane-fusion protein)
MSPPASRRLRVAASLGLLFAVITAAGCSRSEDSEVGARQAVMTVTATPRERVELTRTVAMNGSVHAWQDVIISSEVGGYRVAEVLVDVGDHVKKGQRLVSLSTALLEAEVATKRATLSQREAELANAVAALWPISRCLQ